MSFTNLVGNNPNPAQISANPAHNTAKNADKFADYLSEQERIEQASAEKIAEHNAAVQKPQENNSREEFLDFMGKDSAERMREQVLLALGITEEELDAMPPEERQKVEMKIAAIIEEKIRMATEEQLEKSAVAAVGGDVNEHATVADAVEAQEEIALYTDDARKDDWLAALGLPQDGKVMVGFTAYGDLKMTGQNALAASAAEEIL